MKRHIREEPARNLESIETDVCNDVTFYEEGFVDFQVSHLQLIFRVADGLMERDIGFKSQL